MSKKNTIVVESDAFLRIRRAANYYGVTASTLASIIVYETIPDVGLDRPVPEPDNLRIQEALEKYRREKRNRKNSDNFKESETHHHPLPGQTSFLD
jgi:hypothetical protein